MSFYSNNNEVLQVVHENQDNWELIINNERRRSIDEEDTTENNENKSVIECTWEIECRSPPPPSSNSLSPPSENSGLSNSSGSERGKKGRRKSWHAIRFDRKRRKDFLEGGTGRRSSVSSSSIVHDEEIEDQIEGDEEGVVSGIGSFGSGTFLRPKRHSWWNIFGASQQWARSRRTSQDCGKLPKENLHWMRSKSRSLDHGITSLNFEATRAKVDDKLEGNSERDVDNLEKKKSTLQVKTTVYTVADRDTLTSLAARFDTTPSELTKLNRLATPYIFPGQQINIPLRGESEGVGGNGEAGGGGGGGGGGIGESNTGNQRHSDYYANSQFGFGNQRQSHDQTPIEEKALLDFLRPASPKPGHVERIRTISSSSATHNHPLNDSNHEPGHHPSTPTPPPHQSDENKRGNTRWFTETSSPSNKTENQPQYFPERFLKINVRHITDGEGVVGGVLLVTPNAVMFDPNVSDPLVIEHGPEAYGVIAPMEFVVNSAIYNDIAHMRVNNTSSSSRRGGDEKTNDRPEVYYPSWDKEEDEEEEEEEEEGEGGASSACQIMTSRDEDDGDGNSSMVMMVKDETFPELVTGDDGESVCSGTEREEGDAFPKAFERELVTPTNLSTIPPVTPPPPPPPPSSSSSSSSLQLAQPLAAIGERNAKIVEEEGIITSSESLEERRKSLIDHHWAIPSRDRSSVDIEELSLNEIDEIVVGDEVGGLKLGNNSVGLQQQSEIEIGKNCHDSGIDISGSGFASSHKKLSDADIVLSTNWIPPPAKVEPGNYGGEGGRKKTNSVSFSLDSSSEADIEPLVNSNNNNSVKDGGGGSKEHEKAETKKNKMLKRLSYPLSWMENLGGDKDEEKLSTSASEVQHSSVFSKVFSSSPINLVDFGTGLFYPNKTPSEESWSSSGGGGGGFGGSGSGSAPHSAATTTTSSIDSPRTTTTNTSSNQNSYNNYQQPNSANSIASNPSSLGSGSGGGGASSFFPSAIISSVGSVGSQVGMTVASIGTNVGRSSMSAFIGKQHPTSSESSIPSTFSSSKSSKTIQPKLDYRSMVSVEDVPELFVSFDKLIPRPACSCDDPPLYLRLRMGKPLNKPIPRSTPLISYGKKRMRPEYWFSVPRNRVEDLYRFIQTWIPHLYGELDEEKVKERGFELVEIDTELWNDENVSASSSTSTNRHNIHGDDISDITKESWELIKAPYFKIYSIIKTQTLSADDGSDEVIPMSDDFYAAVSSVTPSHLLDIGGLELSPPPDLIGTTEILMDAHRESLCRHLPARAEGYAWTLIFSTSQHGFSLNSMYRKMHKLESPVLLVIKDTDNNVFGALTSCALHVSEHFYGTGESLLYRFTPEFQVFNWTGENLYFIKGNNESLSIGAGDGKFGLWLDGDLYLGRSEPCQTYANEPLTPKSDFIVKIMECWTFVSN